MGKIINTGTISVLVIVLSGIAIGYGINNGAGTMGAITKKE